MSDEKKPPLRVESLLFPKLVELIGQAESASLPTDEASVSETLTPMVQLLLNKKAGPLVTFGLMCRGATLFLVDFDEFTEAVASAGPAPANIELPPLPYPRIAVECSEDYAFNVADVSGGPVFELEIFAINETIQGERWDVFLLMRNSGTYHDPDQSVGMFELYRDGSIVQYVPSKLPGSARRFSEGVTKDGAQGIAAALEKMNLGDFFEGKYWPPDNATAMGVRSIPLEFAHLVNARGVTSESVPVARGQRRRFDKQRISHPSVYFVRIGGETDSHPGSGDREYHHRWLVRGHWRHFRRGGRSWVRPYIKGPAGAPWKGRPVYVIPPHDELKATG